MNEKEIELEKEHLNNVLFEIDKQIEKTGQQIVELEKEMKELISHFSEEYYNMDDEEAVCGGDELDEHETILLVVKNGYNRLQRQRMSPYFGRRDFKEDGEITSRPY